MNLRHCFDILELSPAATREEARQAYKDIVNVWHPDRFSNNPRLKRKAEMKLKEINAAYAEIDAFIASRDTGRGGDGRVSATGSGRSGSAGEDDARDTVEVVAEAGTRLVLGAWSYLSKALGRLGEDRGEGRKTGGAGNGGENR
jgi:curved DNA-binding protein CbpA